MIKKIFYFSILAVFSLNLQAQSTNIPLNIDAYHSLDRFDIKGGADKFSLKTGFKAIRRIDVLSMLDSLDISDKTFSKIDKFNYTSLLNDNWEINQENNSESAKPLLRRFYKRKADFYHVSVPDFDLHLNPVLYLGLGNDNSRDATPFINTRGLELRGSISNKIGFYSFIGENQTVFPNYVKKFTSDYGVPHQGFWKNFKEDGVDFFTARGYIDFMAAKYINFQFGHDRFKIGNGHRSLLLSDFSNNYLFLKINTKIWKISYTNLFTQMNTFEFGVDNGPTFGNRRLPAKFMAIHRLGLDITKNINIGLFEAVIFGDSTRKSYDINYLNPIIFYRAIEQQNGSADNALIGLDFKANILRRYSLYGQVLFDEFKLQEFTAGTGWWANKYALQLGAKYLDILGLSNLDLQIEGNLARPYTYSHRDKYTNYTHYGQSLAHPLGANFRELITILRFQPMPRLSIEGKMILAKYGSDTLASNWGGNTLLSFRDREMEFNNEIGQGVTNDLMKISFTATYQVKHNLFIDVEHTSRKNDNEVFGVSKTSYTAIAIRLNIPKRLHDF